MDNLLSKGNNKSGLFEKIRAGGFYFFLIRIIERSFNIVKLIIIARLLAPDDFGLFGLAMLAITIFDTFSHSGFEGALIHKKENIESYLDTVWTIQAIRGIVLFILLFTFSPLIATFFQTKEVSIIIKILALSQLFIGFKNIGVIYFFKELEFYAYFIYSVLPVCVDLLIVVIIAVIFKNVWALILGFLLKSIITTIWSYIIHDYRPKIKFNLKKAKDLFDFGKWGFSTHVLNFLLMQGDDILVGRICGIAALGYYQMAYKISNIPTTEITNVVSRIMFPAYSKLQDSKEKLKKAYFQVLQIILFISFPLAFFLFIFAYDFTLIFLGKKWLSMVPTMRILCCFGLIGSFEATIGPLFFGIGIPKINTELRIKQFAFLSIAFYPLIKQLGILGAAIAVLLSTLITQFLSFRYLVKFLNCSYTELLNLFILPLAGSTLTGILVLVCRMQLSDLTVFTFSILFVIGILLYIAISLLFEKFFSYETIKIIKRLLILENG